MQNLADRKPTRGGWRNKGCSGRHESGFRGSSESASERNSTRGNERANQRLREQTDGHLTTSRQTRFGRGVEGGIEFREER
jgi:hypothetical protein